MIAMNAYSAAQLLQAYRDGILLRDAVAQFAPQLDRAELLRSARLHRSVAETGKRNWSAANIGNADEIFTKWTKTQIRLDAAAKAGVSQEVQLIAALEGGELLAIGFDTAKGTAARPELVPQFLLQRQFAKFAKSEFRDGEWRYAKVRIAPVNALAKPKIGRPTVREQVFAIAEAAESDIRSMSVKAQAREIRKLGKMQFPTIFSDNSPDDRTIERHLRTYWNKK